jgi:hypothetical protein
VDLGGIGSGSSSFFPIGSPALGNSNGTLCSASRSAARRDAGSRSRGLSTVVRAGLPWSWPNRSAQTPFPTMPRSSPAPRRSRTFPCPRGGLAPDVGAGGCSRVPIRRCGTDLGPHGRPDPATTRFPGQCRRGVHRGRRTPRDHVPDARKWSRGILARPVARSRRDLEHRLHLQPGRETERAQRSGRDPTNPTRDRWAIR